MPLQQRAVTRSSAERRVAIAATPHRSGLNLGGTCTQPMRSGSIASKRTDRLTIAIEPHLWQEFSRDRKADFTMTGAFATLSDVVQHYNSTFSLGLNTQDVRDLVEYLKSL